MSQCPHCGANVADGAHSCHNCGAQLGRQQGHGQGGQNQPQQGGQPRQGGQRQPQGGQGQPRQGGQGQPQQGGQPRQGGQRQPQGGQRQPQQGGQQYQQGGQQYQQGGGGQPPQGGYQQGAQYGGGDDGLGRRELLVGGGAAVAAAAGGWYFFFRGSTPGGPEGVVYDYVDAFESGDPQSMDELVHQNSPARGGSGGLVSEVEENANADLSASVESTEIVSRRDAPNQPNVQEFATVKATISTSRGDQPSETNTLQFVVAKNSNGEWKFWEQTFATQESESTTETPPNASFSFDYTSGGGQNGDGLLTITHTSGEAVPSQELYIQGENVEEFGRNPAGQTVYLNWSVLADISGTEDVMAGDYVELDAMSDYEASVVWASPDSDDTATLSEGEGPDA